MKIELTGKMILSLLVFFQNSDCGGNAGTMPCSDGRELSLLGWIVGLICLVGIVYAAFKKENK